MSNGEPSTGPTTNWAYAYELTPPQAEERLRGVKTLLEDAHRDAKQGARTWEGRLVQEQLITHILVVSDNPDQDTDVNRRLAAELRNLEAGFFVTLAMAVPDQLTRVQDSLVRAGTNVAPMGLGEAPAREARGGNDGRSSLRPAV
jgi:hypothetical protein